MNPSSLFSLYFVLLVLLLAGYGRRGRGMSLDDCRQSRCGRRGPPIRFPFRLKDRQPEHCGYPGFDLTCTDNDRQTLLELPTSARLRIDRIDYVFQSILASDPDACLPRQLLNSNLSTSPFSFGYMFKYDFAFFNCTSMYRTMDSLSIPCLSVPGYDVYAFPSDIRIGDAALTSCAKMYNRRSVPQDIISRDNILHLNWSVPVCPFCEARGKYCGWKSNVTRTEIGCFDRPKTTGGTMRKVVASVTTIGSFLVFLLLCVVFRIYSNKRAEKQSRARIEQFLEDYKAFKPTRYLYADVKRITNDFEDKLGQGAYGTVFKGKLSDEIFVAVKILNSLIGNGEEFVNEVGTMGRIHHVNVVRLVGYCADGFRRALIYEYLPNDSLEKVISYHLGWEKLQDIALGMAKGIEYLHQGCDQRILHFDIKPHNILLDQNFNPKISDFGLAKLCSKDQSAVSMTTARGTMGYIAPEVFSRNFGNVSYKSDVYSFGMVLLEMVGGRKHTSVTVDNTSQINFPEWAYKCLDQGEELRIQIEEENDAHIARKLTIVGLWCIQWHPMDRPPMKTVVQMLEGEGNKLTMPPNPFASSGSAKMNGNVPGRPFHPGLTTIAETE